MVGINQIFSKYFHYRISSETCSAHTHTQTQSSDSTVRKTKDPALSLYSGGVLVRMSLEVNKEE